MKQEKVLFLTIDGNLPKKPFFSFLQLVPQAILIREEKEILVYQITCGPYVSDLNRLFKKAVKIGISFAGVFGPMPRGVNRRGIFLTAGLGLREAIALREIISLAEQKPAVCMLAADEKPGQKLVKELLPYFHFISLYGNKKEKLERLAAEIYDHSGLACPVFDHKVPQADYYFYYGDALPSSWQNLFDKPVFSLQKEQFFIFRHPEQNMPFRLPSAFAAAFCLAVADKDYGIVWQAMPEEAKRKSWNLLLNKAQLVPRRRQIEKRSYIT